MGYWLILKLLLKLILANSETGLEANWPVMLARLEAVMGLHLFAEVHLQGLLMSSYYTLSLPSYYSYIYLNAFLLHTRASLLITLTDLLYIILL